MQVITYKFKEENKTFLIKMKTMYIVWWFSLDSILHRKILSLVSSSALHQLESNCKVTLFQGSRIGLIISNLIIIVSLSTSRKLESNCRSSVPRTEHEHFMSSLRGIKSIPGVQDCFNSIKPNYSSFLKYIAQAGKQL